MLSKEEYKKNVRRMFDSLRTECKGEDNCAGVRCSECPFNDVQCSLGGSKFYLFETMEIVENWVKEHPVVTNAMKFKEVFGVDKSIFFDNKPSCEGCQFHVIDGTCNVIEKFWNKEYKEQEPSTGSGQECSKCHEIHKRYGKGMTKEVKGFSSVYPSMCNLKLTPNIDGTWLTIRDNADTSMTIKLADLEDIIHSEVPNNEESEVKEMNINHINFAIDVLSHPQSADESDINMALGYALESLKAQRREKY